ncbi:MAG: hypothetical protein MSC31_16885 [Solirubrobacteraceae bacterium MAG38_C4-C5]|nr:hypothetical protein [Candidatus Siliceabacter maunaloa]
MIELEDVKGRLADMETVLTEAHVAAAAVWETLLTEHPAIALPFDTTTRANIIHDHLCAELGWRLADTPGVELTDCLGFTGLKVGQDILLRFKFVGHGAPSNVATEQQKLLARQEYSEDMTLVLTGDPALKPPTLLTCGHTLDGAKVGRIEIRRDCKGHRPWMYDIYGGTRVVAPIAFPGMQDAAKPATVRKTTERKKDTGTGTVQSA